MDPAKLYQLRSFGHRIRHHTPLRHLGPLWDAVKPGYEWFSQRLSARGMKVRVNGMETVEILPRLFTRSEMEYEPEIFKRVMADVRPGDTIVELGGCFGMYTIPFARRVIPGGKVIVFEPDPSNFLALSSHLRFNKVADSVELLPFAISKSEGTLHFCADAFDSSHLASASSPNARLVKATTLDRALAGRKIDILKIDVEGFEEDALRGGAELLKDRGRCPRIIYIETHVQFWDRCGTTSDSLLSLLRELEYQATSMDGKVLRSVETYGEIFATKTPEPQGL